MHHGSGAHGAGLQGDVHLAVGQPVISECASSLAQRNNFRMGRGVMISEIAIATPTDQHRPPSGHHGPSRHLA